MICNKWHIDILLIISTLYVIEQINVNLHHVMYECEVEIKDFIVNEHNDEMTNSVYK